MGMHWKKKNSVVASSPYSDGADADDILKALEVAFRQQNIKTLITLMVSLKTINNFIPFH